MKCPFLMKRKDVYDEDGKKVDEEIELLACLKNECMVYDSATKLCSLLSSNMKTGVLIDDYKKGVKEIKEEIYQRAEALVEGFTQPMEKLQEGLLSRLDVQKKQIEVMILGFDKIQETFSTRLEDLKMGLQDVSTGIANALAALGTANEKQGGDLKATMLALQEKLTDINNTNMRLADDLLTGVGNLGERLKGEFDMARSQNTEALKEIAAKFDELSTRAAERAETDGVRSQALIDKISSIDDVMKNVVNELRFEASTTADRFKDELSKYIEGVKSEVVNLKTGQVVALNGLQSELVQVRELFTKSSDSMDSMREMMTSLNSNYLESLGKIAGLTEGMRKGVEEIGESMTRVMRDMTTETHNQMGAVANQYEKTFGDVAKLTERFEDVKNRLGEMTTQMTQDFKESLDRQSQLAEHTKGILESIRTFLQQEEKRFEKEEELSRKKTALDHFDRATLYYYRANFELALNEIEKAIEIDKTAEYLNLSGLILAELGRYDDSKKAYLGALELEPEYSELHNNLGLLFLKMKKLDEAVLSFQESVKKNVNNALAYVNLGKALIELEKYDEALTAYNKALEIDPGNHEAREAIRLYKEGRIET
ncbi:MAG: tetratricopeptide repeat protein [candidate division WOR-3 bacterium]